jgi:hypothetical protein
MRMVFGVLSLLVVVAIVGVLVKKQLGTVAPTPAAASTSGTSASGAPVLSGSPQQQVRQFKNAAESAVQAPRPMPDEK